MVVGVLPTGPLNAITDVAGVGVGHATLIEGDSLHTGVTAIVPHGGNLLMGDEGIGVHIVRELQKQDDLDGVDLVDGGTDGLYLLDYFSRIPRVVLVDATVDGQPSATITVLTPKYSSDYPPILTEHDIGLKDLLDILYLMEKQPQITPFDISIAGIDRLRVELDPELFAARPQICQAIANHISSR